MAENANAGFEQGSEDNMQTTDLQNDIQLTRTATELQAKLDQLRQTLALERAKLATVGAASMATDNDNLYRVTRPMLEKLEEEKVQTFLNFSSLRAAVRAAQANQAIAQALQLDGSSSNLELEPEEESFVRELLQQHMELTQDLLKTQEEGSKQELQLFKMRAELAMSYCKYMELREEAGSLLPSFSSEDKGAKDLRTALQQEDYRLNQIRIMCQKLMMAYPKLGLQFDEQTNAHFKSMFFRCGMSPDELRAEKAGSK